MTTQVDVNQDTWTEIIAPAASWGLATVAHGDVRFHIAPSKPDDATVTIGHQVTGGWGIERSQFQGGLWGKGQGAVMVDSG